jgi:hypothetical protein
MKTTKLFFMAALALLMTACSNDDELTQQPAEQPGNNMITVTAQLAPKSGSAQTRALSDQTTYIKAEWAENEQMKIISDNGHTATATINNVTGGVATISFTIDAAAIGQNCTIVYPATAATTTGVKTYADLFANQDGTLSANLDVRVGAGTISTDDPGTLTVTTQPAAQFSIFSFGFKDLGNATVTATKLIISDASDNVITTVTQTPALGTMYVALPELAVGTYWLNATSTASKPYIRKVKIETATSAGTFYNALVNMATLGDIMCTDGSFYDTQTEADAASKTAVAIIAYIGSETGDASHKHGLAIAISDEMESGTSRKSTNWTNAKGICEGKPTVASATWYMPSVDQWKTMFKANGGNDSDCNGLKSTIVSSTYYNSTHDPSLADGYFWSSTEDSSDNNNAYYLYLYSSGSVNFVSDTKNYANKIRAVLAF